MSRISPPFWCTPPDSLGRPPGSRPYRRTSPPRRDRQTASTSARGSGATPTEPTGNTVLPAQRVSSRRRPSPSQSSSVSLLEPPRRSAARLPRLQWPPRKLDHLVYAQPSSLWAPAPLQESRGAAPYHIGEGSGLNVHGRHAPGQRRPCEPGELWRGRSR